MKIHEYQAKEILAKYGVAVPKGEVANTLEEANDVARKLFAEGASGVVVKAQIHAGGRGKGGGVKVARTREDAELHAKNILGMQLVTHQTGPQGQRVQRLLIEETAAIDRELYLGIVLDRAIGQAGVHGVAGGRHGDRGSGRQGPGGDLQGEHRSGGGVRRVAGAQAGVRAGTEADADQPRGGFPAEPVSRVHRNGRVARWRSIRSSPRRTTSCSRWTRRSTSTTTRCSGTRTSRRCATLPKKIRWKWRRASTR